MLKKQKSKQFLRPNLIKILVAIIFLFISFYLSETTPPAKHPFLIETQTSGWVMMPPVPGGLDVFYYGFPLESVSKACGGGCVYEIKNYFNFIFDLLFWYFISCLVVSSYNKLKTRSRKFSAETDL